jgi:hypothetical protein
VDPPGEHNVETGQVRKHVVQALTELRERAQQRRARSADAERDFVTFLDAMAIPLARQVAGALKAEGYAVTVFTPGRGLRLALDKGRDDFVDIRLEAEGAVPQVIGQISYTRGSRTILAEQPVKEGAGPAELTEQDMLDFLIRALEPLLER